MQHLNRRRPSQTFSKLCVRTSPPRERQPWFPIAWLGKTRRPVRWPIYGN